jgi:hypothetical protein
MSGVWLYLQYAAQLNSLSFRRSILFSVFFPSFFRFIPLNRSRHPVCAGWLFCARVFVFRFLVFCFLFSGFSCFSILFYLLSLFLLSGGFMAHLVESMAYVNQVPWHGLGNQLYRKATN